MAKKADVWDGLSGAVPAPTGPPGRRIYKAGIALDPDRPKGFSLGAMASSSATPRLETVPVKAHVRKVARPQYKNPWGLTGREAEILTWIVELGSRKEVMAALKISEPTYDQHVIACRKKLKAKTAMACVLKWAYWVWSDETGQEVRAEILGIEDADT